MATSSSSAVPDVRITQIEGGANKGAGGFLVTCGSCPRFHTIRKMRIDADLAATGHVRSHGRPHPEDEVDPWAPA